MLRMHIRKEVESDTCFVCKKKFEKDDDTVLIFDKAFGGKVKIHRYHHHEEKKDIIQT